MGKNIDEALEIVRELYEHLEYCNWGDSWERECSENLRDKTIEFLERKPPKAKAPDPNICPTCNGNRFIRMTPYVRGVKPCPDCSGHYF